MAYETELKFTGVDFDVFRNTLTKLGATCKGSHLERNLVFDTPERSFKDSDMLLRLREKRWVNGIAAVLTLKRPPQVDVPEDVKVYDEQETHVGNADAMHVILESLGYDAVFRYDKVREEWTLGELEICLDSLPFGDVVELEGERDTIMSAVEALGLSLEQSSTDTYHDLNREYRKAEKLKPDDNFVFSDEALAQLLKEFPGTAE